MVKPRLIWLIFLTLYANFRITLCFMKSNGCVALLNILNINLQKYHNVKQGIQGLQVLAFCVANINSTVDFKQLEYLKDLIILNILKKNWLCIASLALSILKFHKAFQTALCK